MKHAILENIYKEIVLLPDAERAQLYDRIRRDYYQNSEIIAYTTNGKALTLEQYRKEVNAGIEQCLRGEKLSLENLSKKLGYSYADL